MTILSRSEQDTFHAGFSLGEKLAGGAVVLLTGFLGAGKTVFVKGMAAALKITDEVLSPTFTLLREYTGGGGLTLYHIDAYRLKNAREAEEAGIAETIGAADAVTAVEWHENIAELLQNRQVTSVEIRFTDQAAEREITIYD